MLDNICSHAPAVLRLLCDRIKRGGDDISAASVRMLLALAVLIYLVAQQELGQNLPINHREIVYLAMIYFGYATVQWLSNLIWPGPVFFRRAVSIITDAGIITYALIIAGETATPFFGGYLWVTIANGLRFGRHYLIATNIFCVLGFATVLLFSPYWHSQLVLGLGLMVWLILLPGYVAALLKRLEAALHKANQVNKTKSDFLANMSHELRTPLNAIIGYSEMLQEDATANNDKQAADDLGKIQLSANHLLGLINDILDLSKVESGKFNVINECFDVRIFFEDILNGMQPLFEKKNNLCSIDFELSQYQVNTDKLKLKQVLINLLGNANKFTTSGHIHVLVSRRIDKMNSSLDIQIGDNGIGIPRDKLATIFDPFTQADNSTTRKYEGTGLGLAITKRFVDMLGGEISVISEEGKGSMFSIHIPGELHECPVYTDKMCELEVHQKMAG